MSPDHLAAASSTSTTSGARDHARAQAGARADAMATVPAHDWPGVRPDQVAAEDLVWAETVAGGGYTSKLLARGSTVRITDLSGDACAHLLLFNADQTWERLNVADTVKVLWQAYLGVGQLLLSDQGRVLASIVADTSGRHDALCGTSSRLRNEERYGDGAPQGPSPAGRELQVLAVSKHGMSERDVGPGVSFFKGVRAGADGALTFAGARAPSTIEEPAPFVQLRAELPLVVVIANVPHPLDPRSSYTCSTLEVLAWGGPATAVGDPLRTATPEAERAFLNTDDYLTARGVR
jgi:urea carboxylase-associated protein 2